MLPESDTPATPWYAVGMFAPPFFTGTPTRRFGAPRIMQVGLLRPIRDE